MGKYRIMPTLRGDKVFFNVRARKSGNIIARLASRHKARTLVRKLEAPLEVVPKARPATKDKKVG